MAKITRAHKVCDQQLHVLQERAAELEAKLAAKWISADAPPKLTEDGPEFVLVLWEDEWRGKRLERSLSEEGQRDDSTASASGQDVAFIPYLLDEAMGKWSHWQPLPPAPEQTT